MLLLTRFAVRGVLAALLLLLLLVLLVLLVLVLLLLLLLLVDDDDNDVSSPPHQSNPMQSRHTPHGAYGVRCSCSHGTRFTAFLLLLFLLLLCIIPTTKVKSIRMEFYPPPRPRPPSFFITTPPHPAPLLPFFVALFFSGQASFTAHEATSHDGDGRMNNDRNLPKMLRKSSKLPQ